MHSQTNAITVSPVSSLALFLGYDAGILMPSVIFDDATAASAATLDPTTLNHD